MEEDERWPGEVLDAYIEMIPKVDERRCSIGFEAFVCSACGVPALGFCSDGSP